MYLCIRRKIWTSFSCLVLQKCYHVVFLQFKFPANLAQLVVPKMHCLYANAVVQPSVQHCSCYMAWKTKVHTWCRHCHLCINAPMWKEKRWLQELFDPPSYSLAVQYETSQLRHIRLLVCDLVSWSKWSVWIFSSVVSTFDGLFQEIEPSKGFFLLFFKIWVLRVNYCV